MGSDSLHSRSTLRLAFDVLTLLPPFVLIGVAATRTDPMSALLTAAITSAIYLGILFWSSLDYSLWLKVPTKIVAACAFLAGAGLTISPPKEGIGDAAPYFIVGSLFACWVVRYHITAHRTFLDPSARNSQDWIKRYEWRRAVEYLFKFYTRLFLRR